MQRHEKLLLANKAWALDKLELDEFYFEALAADQKPDFLWIGCSDSRVSAEEITGTLPGEMFVHRNIANQVISSDLNLLSVLQYAVEVLKVRHVIVCGHYECGGVKAALHNRRYGLIDNWLQNIQNVKEKYFDELKNMPDEPSRFNRLVELSTREQVYNLGHTAIVQNAWNQKQPLWLHGWVFDIHNGQLKEIVNLSPEDKADVQFVRDLGDEDGLAKALTTDIRLLK
ncbi:carbonic anhydrase [Larkinella humicola]|uniref:Carbonic anhydrase n=1 Tax=Larkinella humicola TaxID=2607654 RepID=A0A5N1JPY2_9BACT|nr:carbonic anhydrase [Larkinella humicola]KAA9357537.1 carbonic anhydrase [Larkinella humicola]